MDTNVNIQASSTIGAEQNGGREHQSVSFERGAVSAKKDAEEVEEGTTIIDGQSCSHANPNLEEKQTGGPISVDTSSSPSPVNELDQTEPLVKSDNAMDLTFSIRDEDEDEDDEEDEMDEGDGAEYDITTGSTITGAGSGGGGGGDSDFGASSVLLQNMSHHNFDDIQFFPSLQHRNLRHQPQFQFHQDQLNDPNFHNLSYFDSSGLVNLSGSGSVTNSYSLISGDSSSGDINSAFSESPFVFPDNVMEYGEPQFFPGNCVGYLETILEEDDEEIEEEEGCSGRHWWTADSDTDTDSVIRVDNNGQTQQQKATAFQHASGASLTIPGEKDDVKHHFRSSASSKPFELEDLHLFDQLDHAFEETLSEPRKRPDFGFGHQSQSVAQLVGDDSTEKSLNNAGGDDDDERTCQRPFPNPGGNSHNSEEKKGLGHHVSVESVDNKEGSNELATKGLNMLTEENVKAHSVENSNIIYDVSEEKDQSNKKLGNAESRETFGSSLSPSSSDSEAPPEVAEEDFFYSSPGSEEEECPSQEETETDSCSSDDSEKKGVVLAEFSLGSAGSGGGFNSGMFGSNRSRRSFEAPSRLKSFRSFDSLNCLAGTELLFSKPETFPSIHHIKEVSEPSSESESSNERGLIPEEDEEDISEEEKRANVLDDDDHNSGTKSLPNPPSSTLHLGSSTIESSNKNSTSSPMPIINSTTASSTSGGLRSTENLSEDSGIGNEANDGISSTAASTPGAFIEESNVIMSSNGKQASPHDECKTTFTVSSTPTPVIVQESSLPPDSAKDYISSAEFALNPFVYSSLSSSDPDSSISSLTLNGASLHSISKINAISNDQSLQSHLNGKDRLRVHHSTDQDITSSNDKSLKMLINSLSETESTTNANHHPIQSNGSAQIDTGENCQDKRKLSNNCNLSGEGQPIIISNSGAVEALLSNAKRGEQTANTGFATIEELANISKSARLPESPANFANDKEICGVVESMSNSMKSSPFEAMDGVFSMSKVDEEEHSSSSSYSSSSGDEQHVPRFHRQRSDSESEYELAETALQKDNEKMAYDIIVNSPKKKKGLEGRGESSSSSSSSSSSLSSSSLAHEQLTMSSSVTTTTSTSAPTIQAAKQHHPNISQDEMNTNNKCNEKSGPVSALSSSSLINIHRNDDGSNCGSNMKSDRRGEDAKSNHANTAGMRNERLPVFESSIDDYDEEDHRQQFCSYNSLAENTSHRVAKTLPISENIQASSNNMATPIPDGGMGVSSHVNISSLCSTTTSQHEDESSKPSCKDHHVMESSTARLLHHHQLPPEHNNKREQYENSDELTELQSERLHMLSMIGSVGGGGGEASVVVSKEHKKFSGQVETQQTQPPSQNNNNIHQDHHNSLRSSVRLDESTSADVAHNRSNNNPQQNLIERQNAFHPATAVAGAALKSNHSSNNSHHPLSQHSNSDSAANCHSHCYEKSSDPGQREEAISECHQSELASFDEDQLVFADSYCPNQIDTAVVKKFLATYVAPKESSGSFFGPLEYQAVASPSPSSSSSFGATTCAEKDSAGGVITHKSKNKHNGEEAVVIVDYCRSQSAKNPSVQSTSTRSNFGSVHSHDTRATGEAVDETHDQHHEYGFPFSSHHQVRPAAGKDLHSSQDTWQDEPSKQLLQPLKENNTFCPSPQKSCSQVQAQQHQQQNTGASNVNARRSVSPSSFPSASTTRQDTGKGTVPVPRGDHIQHSTRDNSIYTGIDKFSVGLCAIKAAVVAVAPTIPSYIVEKSRKRIDTGDNERNSDAGIHQGNNALERQEKISRNYTEGSGNLSTPFPKETVKSRMSSDNGHSSSGEEGEHTRDLTTQPKPAASSKQAAVPDILNLKQHSCMPTSCSSDYSEEANIKNSSVIMEDSSVEMQRSDSPTLSGLPHKTMKKYGPRNEVEVVVVSSRTPSPAPGGFASTSSSFSTTSRKLPSSPTDLEPAHAPHQKTDYNDGDGSRHVARDSQTSSIPPPPLSPPTATSTKAHRSRVHFSPVVSEISWRESYIDQSSEYSGSSEDLLTKLENLDGIPSTRGHHHSHHYSGNGNSDSSASVTLIKAEVVGGDEVGSSKVRPLQVYDTPMAGRADSPSSLVGSRGVSPSGKSPILVEKVEMTSSLLHDPEDKISRHALLGESQPGRKQQKESSNEDGDNDAEKVTDLVDFRNGSNNDICGNPEKNGTFDVYEDVEVQIEPPTKTHGSTTLSMVPDLLSQCETTSTTLTHIDVKIEETIPDLNTKNIVLNIGPPPNNKSTQPQRNNHQPQKKADKLPQPHESSTSPEPKQIFPKMFAEDSKNDKRNLSSSAQSSGSKGKKSSKGFSIQGLGSSGKKPEKDGLGGSGANGNGTSSVQHLTNNDGSEGKQEAGVGEATKENKKSSKPGFFERLSKIRLSSGSKNKKQKVHPKAGEIHQEVDPSGPPPVTSTIGGGSGNISGRPLRSANSVNVNGKEKSNHSGANNLTASSAGSVQPILKKSTASSSTLPDGSQFNTGINELGLIRDSENEPDDATQAFENILEEIAGLKSIQLRQEKNSNSSIDKSPTSQQVRSFAKRKQFYTNASSPSPPVSPSSDTRSCNDLDSKLTQFKEDTSRTLDAISKSHPDLEIIEDVMKQRQKSLSPEPSKQYMDTDKRAMAATLPKSAKNPNSSSETAQNSEREWYRLLKSATEKYSYHKGPKDEHSHNKDYGISHKTGIVETDLDTGASREMLDEDMLQLDCKVPCYTMSTSEIPISVASTSVSIVTSAGSPATAAKTRSLTNLSSRLPLSIAPSQFEESTGDLSDSEERAKSLEFLLDENHKSSSVPPENKLRQLETRQLSEHELRIQRSLQRLNVPEWYKQHGTLTTGPSNNIEAPVSTTASKSGTLKVSKRSDYGSSGGLAGGWPGLSTYKAPSMSSLQSNGGRNSGTLNKSNFVRGRPATMSVTRTSKESLLTSGSASHSPSAFERSSFTYGMPFTMTRFGQGRLSTHSNSVSPPSTPDSTAKASYVKKPYLGWRSQEKLNTANAASAATNAGGAPKLSIYLPPAERLAADLIATRARSPVRPPVSDRPPLPKAPPRSEKTMLSKNHGVVNDSVAEGALSTSQVISKQTSMAVVTKLPSTNSIPLPEESHIRNGHTQSHSKNQSPTAASPDVHDSIRQVTTAISHFVSRGPESQTQQRTKPKVAKKPAIWIESSFVGQKPPTK